MPTDEQIIAARKAWIKKFLKIFVVLIIIDTIVLASGNFFEHPVLFFLNVFLGTITLLFCVYFSIKYAFKKDERIKLKEKK